MSADVQNTLFKLTVPGMGSDHCAGIVRQTLTRIDGVGDIMVLRLGEKVTSDGEGVIVESHLGK